MVDELLKAIVKESMENSAANDFKPDPEIEQEAIKLLDYSSDVYDRVVAMKVNPDDQISTVCDVLRDLGYYK